MRLPHTVAVQPHPMDARTNSILLIPCQKSWATCRGLSASSRAVATTSVGYAILQPHPNLGCCYLGNGHVIEQLCVVPARNHGNSSPVCEGLRHSTTALQHTSTCLHNEDTFLNPPHNVDDVNSTKHIEQRQ